MIEPDIYDFKVFNADATFSGSNLTINLYYPLNPEPLHERLKEQPAHGISVFDQLLQKGSAQIADREHPLKPASGGLVILLDSANGPVLVTHRRGMGTPVHKWHHSLNAGFGNNQKHAYSLEGLRDTERREYGEEIIFLTRDKEPWLAIPRGLELYVENGLKTAGLDFGKRKRYFDIELMDAPDTLNVFRDNGDKIFTHQGILSPMWESASSLSIMEVYHAKGITAEELIPMGIEGTITSEGKFRHFREESYPLPLSRLANLRFGDPLEGVEVYQGNIDEGKLSVLVPQYAPEKCLGPEGILVRHPHIFAPDDLLVNFLGSMNQGLYAGKGRLEIERAKIVARMEGKTLLPEGVMRK